MRVFKQTRSFMLGVRAELKKVTWTGRKELAESTLVVIIAVMIVAVFLGIVDYIMQAVVLGGRFSIMQLLAR